MSDAKKNWIITALLLPTSLMLGLYIYIGTFSRLVGDDYCLLYFADRFGLLRSIWYWYLNFEGIFSGVFVDYFLVYFGEKWMGVVIPACLLIWVGSATFSFFVYLEDSFRRTQKILASLALGCALVIVVLVWSPHIQQSFYWWAGLRKYIMPLIFSSLYPGLYLLFVRKNWNRQTTFFWYIVSFSLLFFIGGFSETFDPGLIVAFIYAICLTLLINKFNLENKAFRFLIFGFAGFAIAFIVMVMAPGNSVRQEYFSNSPNIFTVIKIASQSYIDFLSYIPKSWILLSVVLGTLFGTFNLGLIITKKDSPQWWFIGINLLAAFIIPWACFLPYAYVAAQPLLGRAMIDPAFLLSTFLFYCVLLTGRLLSVISRKIRMPVIWMSLAGLTFTLLSGSLLYEGKHFYSLSQVHIEYAKEWDRSQVDILRAVQDGRESLTIPQRVNWAGILEINDNPKFYVNQCISGYYGIQILAASELSPPE